MPVYNPPPAGGAGAVSIPEYDTDPGGPAAEDAWVLRTNAGGFGNPGQIYAFMGLGFPYLGSTPAGYTYQFSYRTTEGTTIRGPLS